MTDSGETGEQGGGGRDGCEPEGQGGQLEGRPARGTQVIEAAVENIQLKQQIFADLERACSPEAILSSNTSTIDITLIGAKTRAQNRILGAHFFSPAHVMPLLEIVRTPQTAPQVPPSAVFQPPALPSLILELKYTLICTASSGCCKLCSSPFLSSTQQSALSLHTHSLEYSRPLHACRFQALQLAGHGRDLRWSKRAGGLLCMGLGRMSKCAGGGRVHDAWQCLLCLGHAHSNTYARLGMRNGLACLAEMQISSMTRGCQSGGPSCATWSGLQSTMS